MRRFRTVLLFYCVTFLPLQLAAAQQPYEYALLIISPDGYTFEAPDAAADEAA